MRAICGFYTGDNGHTNSGQCFRGCLYCRSVGTLRGRVGHRFDEMGSAHQSYITCREIRNMGRGSTRFLADYRRDKVKQIRKRYIRYATALHTI